MAVENPRARARRELDGLGLSMETTSYLVDDRPPGGWDALVTKDELRAAVAELRAEMAELRVELHQKLRTQTWRLTAANFVAFGAFAALVRVL